MFHLCEFSYQRPAQVYKSCSEAKIVEFEEQLGKALDTAQESPQNVFLTEGEAALYLKATATAVRAIRGQTPVIRAHPGR